ncbi:MAG: lipopolysaccharide biosynthesis protein [Thiotrichaceae bacterium]|nr:MAG: lipopolysaccharide biosynthesis protein [Thiotrichaceae bacterium]
MEEEQTKDLQDYIIAIRKRKMAILLVFSIIVFFAISVALLLPAIYKSSSTILIEQQEIPSELVQSTVTSFASEAIQSIQARVMTRTNLLRIIDKFDLYSDVRKVKTTGEIIEQMRREVSLDVLSADVINPRTGRPSVATIAFSLSFSGESPKKVQRVTNELTSLYLSENITSRTQKAEDVSEFFKEELERLGKQIDDLEYKTAQFKEKHADALPQLQGLNMSSLQRKEAELLTVDTRLLVLSDKSSYLAEELATLDPGNPDVPGSVERLKVLQSTYVSAKSRYSDEHPDVIKLKSEIDSLKNETGLVNSASAIAEKLKILNAELAQRKKTYTKEHPDIIVLKGKIKKLNNELSEIKINPEELFYKERPDNPLYISKNSLLNDVNSQLQSAREQRKKIVRKIESIEKALYEAPQVEREYLILKRDYANTVARYQETKAKQMRTDIAKQLESESKGERFTLIEPAVFPEKPISPNRAAIVFLGVVLALACSLGFALVADAISGSVRGGKSIQNILGALPLAVIPYEMNLHDTMKTKRIKKRVVILFAAIIVFALLFIHMVVSPLDVLWFRVLRKIDIFMA